jgi:hypothetical protein
VSVPEIDIDSFLSELATKNPDDLTLATCLEVLHSAPFENGRGSDIAKLAAVVQGGKNSNPALTQKVANLVFESGFFPELAKKHRIIFLENATNKTIRSTIREWVRTFINTFIRYGWKGEQHQEELAEMATSAIKDALAYTFATSFSEAWAEAVQRPENNNYRSYSGWKGFTKAFKRELLKPEYQALWDKVHLNLQKNPEKIGEEPGALAPTPHDQG